MRNKVIIILVILASSCMLRKNYSMNYTVNEILSELDDTFTLATNLNCNVDGKYDYVFFLDIEHGYSQNAGSKIHLYGDNVNWAIVFETVGYNNRGTYSCIELVYIGNCIIPVMENFDNESSSSNMKIIEIVSSIEYERIRNKKGTDMEQFELISPEAKFVVVNGKKTRIEHNPLLYQKCGIDFNRDTNPGGLIGFGDLIRYIHDTTPNIVQAEENEIKSQLPSDIPKLMEIEQFHYISNHDSIIPSKQELYNLIAQIIVSKKPSLWRPKLVANNKWKNWDSGFL